MRDAASLAYLLARCSDTIADAPQWDVTARLQCLDSFHAAIHGKADFSSPEELIEQSKDGEKILMLRARENLAWLEKLSANERWIVLEVLDEIISGQRLDLVRFPKASNNCPMVLESDSQLIDYCQRVAGSVGVFWTKLGFLGEGESFCSETQEAMIIWGRNFGCALQLVNILRDRPEDMKNGRFYLPDTATLVSEDEILHAHDRWLSLAKKWSYDGIRYAQALHGWRLRSATVLPALLALETIEAMEQANWSQMCHRIKVTRPTVFRCLAESLLF